MPDRDPLIDVSQARAAERAGINPPTATGVLAKSHSGPVNGVFSNYRAGELLAVDGNGRAINVPTPYLAIQFGGDDVKGEQTYLSVSGDARTFTPAGGPLAGVGRSRDQDVILWAGRYWIVYTKAPAFGVVSTGFGLAVSDDLVNWTHLPDVDCSAIAGIKRAWGPCWVMDRDAPRVCIAVSTANNDLGPFKMYETHPTSIDMTAWSAPQSIHSGLPTSVFDFYAEKRGNVWVALYKDNDAEFVCRAIGPTALGPWTVTHTGDWMGAAAALGTNPVPMEASHFQELPNGNTGFWFDRYHAPGAGPGDFRGATTYFMETADPTLASGWTAPTWVHTLGRHARVRRMALPANYRDSFRTPHLELARLADYTAPTDYGIPVPWDYVDEDVDDMFTPGDTFATIRNGGIWTASLNVVWLNAAGGKRFAAIRFNEDYVPGVTEKRDGDGYDPAVTLTVTRRLRRGDRVDTIIQSDTAVNLGTVPPSRLRLTRIGS